MSGSRRGRKPRAVSPAKRARKTAVSRPPVVVPTPVGDAGLSLDKPTGTPRALLVLGHGAGGGIEAADVMAAVTAARTAGWAVARVVQPYRLAGRRAPAPTAQLDAAWLSIVAGLRKKRGLAAAPLVLGGRSSGARVACRTAVELGAASVLALAFPLHPPGRPEKSRAGELLGSGVPTLVVQGGNDPFGKPEEFPDGSFELVEVPGGDHGFVVPKRARITQEEAVTVVTDAVVKWLGSLG